MELTWENLNSRLLEEFPDLNDSRFTERVGGLGDWSPGQYVVFGSLFNQYLREQVSASAEARAKVGRFLEAMAQSGSGNIEDLLKIEVLPTLLEKQDTLATYWNSLGEWTRRTVAAIAPRIAPDIVIPAPRPMARAPFPS